MYDKVSEIKSSNHKYYTLPEMSLHYSLCYLCIVSDEYQYDIYIVQCQSYYLENGNTPEEGKRGTKIMITSMC